MDNQKIVAKAVHFIYGKTKNTKQEFREGQEHSKLRELEKASEKRHLELSRKERSRNFQRG